MRIQVVGCSHRSAPIELRERLAFSAEQTAAALEQIRQASSELEAVLLSTCNRVELYTATSGGELPDPGRLGGFLARFHALDPAEVQPQLYAHRDREAVRHLFTVASALDSMVIGESQILGQVKAAYQLAAEQGRCGPLLHAVFQGALKAAHRVANETAIQQRRVSIPSVAVADFARRIFERFDDKQTLVIGAGEMAEETLRYLRDEGAHDIAVVNRSFPRARELAERWRGRALPWEQLSEALVAADLVVSLTGATEPVVRLEAFRAMEPSRHGRPLFILDLAVPRDVDPAIGRRPGVYLYCVDDLQAVCQENQRQRDRELPAALRIVEHEADRFLTDLHHRASAPVIRRLQEGWQKPKEEELRRLLNKLPDLDEHARDEIRQAFDRLLGKLLHPPLESLRDESRHGIPSALLDALAKLFQLKD